MNSVLKKKKLLSVVVLFWNNSDKTIKCLDSIFKQTGIQFELVLVDNNSEIKYQKKIFKWLKQNNIDDKEMLKTFNCGVGFCLIINPKNLNKITKFFTKTFKPYVIGKITTGKNKVKLNGKIDWS